LRPTIWCWGNSPMANPDGRREITLAGFGGQGVILAGVLMGHAAVKDGWFAAGSSSYGAQARGSACRADLVISEKPIDYPHVEAPDILVAMSQGGYDAYHKELRHDGRVLYDAGLMKSMMGPPFETSFDPTAEAITKVGNKQATNLVWLGIVAGFTGWFTKRSLEEAVTENVSERFLDSNLKALAIGLSLGLEGREGHG
jgi:2-oxoglutarate ferredoxin oxidoreductase subunit gamma